MKKSQYSPIVSSDVYCSFSPVDITTYHRGFHGDLNETFFVGNVSESKKKLVKVTHECLQQAIDLGNFSTSYNSANEKIHCCTCTCHAMFFLSAFNLNIFFRTSIIKIIWVLSIYVSFFSGASKTGSTVQGYRKCDSETRPDPRLLSCSKLLRTWYP